MRRIDNRKLNVAIDSEYARPASRPPMSKVRGIVRTMTARNRAEEMARKKNIRTATRVQRRVAITRRSKPIVLYDGRCRQRSEASIESEGGKT